MITNNSPFAKVDFEEDEKERSSKEMGFEFLMAEVATMRRDAS